MKVNLQSCCWRLEMAMCKTLVMDISSVYYRIWGPLLSSARDLQSRVYPNWLWYDLHIEWLCEHAILAPCSDSVKTIKWGTSTDLPRASQFIQISGQNHDWWWSSDVAHRVREQPRAFRNATSPPPLENRSACHAVTQSWPTKALQWNSRNHQIVYARLHKCHHRH